MAWHRNVGRPRTMLLTEAQRPRRLGILARQGIGLSRMSALRCALWFRVSMNRCLLARSTAKQACCLCIAQRSMRLPLNIIEELICGRLLRKIAVLELVLLNVEWRASGQSWFNDE